MSTSPSPASVASVVGPAVDGLDRVFTPEALELLATLHRRFEPRRRELLQRRGERQDEVRRGQPLDFLDDTRAIRADDDWHVKPAPVGLTDRRTEITGPTEAKMAVNALNSGAKVWLADLEDANTPHWHNVVEGQVVLQDVSRGTLEHVSDDGRVYRLDEHAPLAVAVPRPRGWHLDERHVTVDGEPVSGSILDAALYLRHNARVLIEGGSGPYLYLAKLESHLEARLWAEVLTAIEQALGLPVGTVRVTVLIETIPAAFEMDEILYELRDHATGLNAGRWDYLFSLIKVFRSSGPTMVLPDRSQVSMDVPFMRAYTELLVRTCHRRGAHAIGGMSAFIPDRSDPEATDRALAKVRDDKRREAGDGFDGSWGGASRPRRHLQRGDRGSAPRRRQRAGDGDSRGRAGQRRGGCRVPRRMVGRPRRRRDRQPHGGRGHGRDLPCAAVAVGAQRGAAHGWIGRSWTS